MEGGISFDDSSRIIVSERTRAVMPTFSGFSKILASLRALACPHLSTTRKTSENRCLRLGKQNVLETKAQARRVSGDFRAATSSIMISAISCGKTGVSEHVFLLGAILVWVKDGLSVALSGCEAKLGPNHERTSHLPAWT